MFCKYLQALQVPGILTGCSEWQTGFKHSLYIFFALNFLAPFLKEVDLILLFQNLLLTINIHVFP